MEKRIVKNQLNFEKTISYFLNHIGCGKTLSKKILEKIDFKNGSFFTILPENLVKEKDVYKFSSGILPELERIDHPKFANFHPISTMDKEISEFIFGFLGKDKKEMAFFEHVIALSTDPHLDLPGAEMHLFNDEVYYKIGSETSIDVIEEAVGLTNEVLHFLSVLADEIKMNSHLRETDFDRVCARVKYIIVGAYDGEGYIIWERNEK